MRRQITTAAALAVALGAAAAAAQDDGTLDASFDLDGAVRVPFDYGGTLRDVPAGVASMPDGRIVVAGTAAVAGFGDNVAVTRLFANGAIDTGFGASGRAVFGYPTDELVSDVLAEPDGAVVVAGSRPSGASPGPEVFVDRVSSLGFHSTGIALPFPGLSFPWAALARDPLSGKIYVGFSYTFDGSEYVAVDRRLPDLTPDNDYGFFGRFKYSLPGGAQGAVAALEVLPDGSLLVAGTAHEGSGSDLFVSRVTSTGAKDITFGTAGTAIVPLDLVTLGDDELQSMAVDALGRILLSGSAVAPGFGDKASVLLRLTGAGGVDPAFNGGEPLVVADTEGDDALGGLAVQSDGRIVVAGRVFGPASPMFFAARYLDDGSPDWSFGSFGVFTANFPNSPNDDYAVALALSGGRAVLVGPAEWSAPDYDFGVMRLASALIFADDLERGSTGAWSLAAP